MNPERDERAAPNESHLLPCPFCGGQAGFGSCERESPRWWFVCCTDCQASTNLLIPDGGLTEAENKALAVEVWNRRVSV